jgi:hypothetical protein
VQHARQKLKQSQKKIFSILFKESDMSDRHRKQLLQKEQDTKKTNLM